jgi:hypothetical protein
MNVIIVCGALNGDLLTVNGKEENEHQGSGLVHAWRW